MANIPIGEKTEVDMRVSTAYSSTQQHKSKWVQYAIVVVILLVFLFVFHRPSSTSPASSSTSSISIFGNGKNTKIIKAATWNIAAINNNPFEYWITSDDPQYNHLMSNVSSFIVAPGSQDIKIREVFTESMVTELVELLKDAFPTSAEQIKTYYEQNFADKSIVSGFIKDGIIGKKRLVSMPDRVTNTINTADGKTVLRPTVINCFQGDLHDVKTWWKEWKYFVFQEEVTIKKASKTKSNSSTPSPAVITKTKIFQMIPKIEKAKYPSITVEEEAMSAPLSVLSLAIFDAILVHMMNLISSQYHMNWQMMRNQMCQMLNFKKNDRVLSILDTTYGDSDLVFLQEVAGNFLSFTKDKAISHLFDIHQSQYMDPDRDQNSFIMFKKGKYREVVEVTKEVTDILQLQVNAEHGNIPSKLPTVAGDLIVLVAMDADDKTKYIFASFHGDTNGLATKPVVNAVHTYATTKQPDCKLIFGLDANTYAKPEADQEGVLDFAAFFAGKKLNSCYGTHPNPLNFTTFHARTHLQPQLNKAVSLQEKDSKGDKNPKDFILFFDSDYQVLSTTKDNTGSKIYKENMVFPTLAFPSDHGITSTVLLEHKV